MPSCKLTGKPLAGHSVTSTRDAASSKAKFSKSGDTIPKHLVTPTSKSSAAEKDRRIPPCGAGAAKDIPNPKAFTNGIKSKPINSVKKIRPSYSPYKTDTKPNRIAKSVSDAPNAEAMNEWLERQMGKDHDFHEFQEFREFAIDTLAILNDVEEERAEKNARSVELEKKVSLLRDKKVDLLKRLQPMMEKSSSSYETKQKINYARQRIAELKSKLVLRKKEIESCGELDKKMNQSTNPVLATESSSAVVSQASASSNAITQESKSSADSQIDDDEYQF